MIGLVTDSNSQIPDELRLRYGVDVVPLTVVIDGEELLEGVDLGADEFYARLAAGARAVTTSQPSPGRFLEQYRRLVERGVSEIVSIHIGSALSGTLNSARLAAQRCPAPVRLVDTGAASFGISCAVWRAGEALAADATAEEAAAAAEALAPTVGNVFVVQALELARRGGRLVIPAGAELEASGGQDAAVLSLVGGSAQVVGRATSVEEAAEVMAAEVLAGARRAPSGQVRVASGIADAAARPLSEALERRLAASPLVAELVRYRVGPSVGAHTGPGTAGAFWFPA
ncbi:MAG: DegV family protein [Acidimicrobiales bacterium]